ncbi:transcriptional regulator, GntR family [Hathewaya proteolytica DSM 3090]|uniref:Transcriptional regulator, GntR family n=1 Tax=Hathewaya proteolytica DSM 3090 TaxID=1121331 RepID=A0A1M6PXV0_9CLOT|nr:GntR family transcriptional regulator [Hathewaya proteolytica]SHK12732.1 transcriptional regulator, GntR family [Hathewaya proteolytica DSM 3090]
MVNIKINKKNGIPLYLQVKKQIIEQIRLGNFRVGSKMPTERELASAINVSRNTVSTAYNDLEKDGIIKSFQGKGTFVMEEVASWKDKSLKEKVVKVLDIALEEAMENGMSTEEFLELVTETVKERNEIMEKMSFVFVECNIEQSKMFSAALSNSSKMQVIPLTISDLRVMSEKTKNIVKSCEVIITTFNHVNEVTELTSLLNKQIFGVAINPDIGTIVKIARYKDGTRFGCVCISEEFMFKIRQALEKAGLDNVDIAYTNSDDKEELKNFIKYVDVIIVSPGRLKDIKSINVENKDIIEFLYLLDNGSVKALKSKLVEHLPRNMKNMI